MHPDAEMLAAVCPERFTGEQMEAARLKWLQAKETKWINLKQFREAKNCKTQLYRGIIAVLGVLVGVFFGDADAE